MNATSPTCKPRRREAFPTALLASWVILLLTVPAYAAPPPQVSPPPPAPDPPCPVCGMQVAAHRAWIATIILANGKRLDFDGPKDMFRFYYDLAKYEKGLGPKDVREIWVTDYYTARPIDARTAWFVTGSHVLGPMGHELVPVAGQKEAASFRVDHHGKETFPFAKITRNVVDAIE